MYTNSSHWIQWAKKISKIFENFSIFFFEKFEKIFQDAWTDLESAVFIRKWGIIAYFVRLINALSRLSRFFKKKFQGALQRTLKKTWKWVFLGTQLIFLTLCAQNVFLMAKEQIWLMPKKFLLRGYLRTHFLIINFKKISWAL